MKIITLWQPWATLIAFGIKNKETRSWPTKYRGDLVIHAAKRKMDAEGLALLEALSKDYILPAPSEIPYGQIVAVVNLKNCWEMGHSTLFDISGNYQAINDISATEKMCGDWRKGRFAWELTDINRVNPIPFKGGQGLRNIDPSVLGSEVAA